ncbi:MAG: acyltransferase [Lachnospiraceae bacterium]|nr:acyltransferase [Lachnospiraceae bacterium]
MMKNKERIVGLDLVRFLAALGIMAYHYFFIGPIQGFYSADVFYPIAFWGEFGVDIFFILSGVVILFSTENKKTPFRFLKGRMIRLYPAFLICSILTMLTGMIMPGTSKSDLFFRWINSLTLCNDIWGVQPLSSIYWTLMVEMKFYILVAIVMKLGIWCRHKYHILFGWICLSLLNTFGMKWQWLEILFNTKYAGHFTIGIIIYLLYKGQRNRSMIPIAGGGSWLVYRNCISYTEWIRGIYEGGGGKIFRYRYSVYCNYDCFSTILFGGCYL